MTLPVGLNSTRDFTPFHPRSGTDRFSEMLCFRNTSLSPRSKHQKVLSIPCHRQKYLETINNCHCFDLEFSYHVSKQQCLDDVASTVNRRTRTKATLVLIIAFQQIIPFSASIFCAQRERKVAPCSVYESSNFTVG